MHLPADPSKSAFSYLRAACPVRFCCDELAESAINLSAKTVLTRADLDVFDIFIFHGVCREHFLPHVEWIAQNKRLVWSLDDDLFQMPQWNPNRSLIEGSGLQVLQHCLSLAQNVIVTTNRLRIALGHRAKTAVCPNLINLEDYTSSVGKRSAVRPHVLWAGGDTHAADLELIADLPDKVDRGRLTFFGDSPVGLKERIKDYDCYVGAGQTEVRYVPPVVFSEYHTTLARINADIGLCPLVDCAFNRAKSELKVLEYWAMRMPVIASAAEPYKSFVRDGGRLVPAGQSFVGAEVSYDMGEAGYERVRKHHAWQSRWARLKWIDTFQKLTC